MKFYSFVNIIFLCYRCCTFAQCVSSGVIVKYVYRSGQFKVNEISITLFGHFDMLVGYISFSPNNHGRIFSIDFLAQGNSFDVLSIWSLSNAASMVFIYLYLNWNYNNSNNPNVLCKYLNFSPNFPVKFPFAWCAFNNQNQLYVYLLIIDTCHIQTLCANWLSIYCHFVENAMCKSHTLHIFQMREFFFSLNRNW